jgi:Ser-tRNA(Ala) deacylase AlaX
MQTLLKNFSSQLDEHFGDFLIHVSKRYRVDIKQLLKDYKEFQKGDLEILKDDEPVKTANKLKDLQEDSESSSDDESEVKTRVKQITDVIDSSDDNTVEMSSDESSSSSSSDDTVELSSESEIDLDGSGSSDSSESDKPVSPKKKKKNVVIQEPLSEDEDDEPSESSEPKPKEKKEKAKKKAKVHSIDDLSDTPKAKDHPKLPKKIKFLKGTNLVVVKGKVVAAVTKKAFVPLNKTYLKSFERPEFEGIKYDQWDKEKVNKKLN